MTIEMFIDFDGNVTKYRISHGFTSKVKHITFDDFDMLINKNKSNIKNINSNIKSEKLDYKNISDEFYLNRLVQVSALIMKKE